jgi:hypothetical protein
VVQKRGGVVRECGPVTEDLIKSVKGFELHPEGKGEPVQSLRARVIRLA